MGTAAREGRSRSPALFVFLSTSPPLTLTMKTTFQSSLTAAQAMRARAQETGAAARRELPRMTLHRKGGTMNTRPIILAIVIGAGLLLPGTTGCGEQGTAGGDRIVLPAPVTEGGMPLVEAIAQRRSVRSYTDEPLTREQISQIAWAAQGITEPTRGFRAAPSAGALYPLEIYFVTGDGVFHYLPQGHALERLQADDRRMALAQAASNQRHVGEAALDIVIAAVFERTERKYGERARTYVYMEAGHVAQNVHLQAVALELASCPVGALREESVREVLGLPARQVPMYIVTVGHAR